MDNAKSFLAIAVMFAVFSAWLTHVIVCLLAHWWGLLVAGAIFFPIGIIHGVMIWLGYYT